MKSHTASRLTAITIAHSACAAGALAQQATFHPLGRPQHWPSFRGAEATAISADGSTVVGLIYHYSLAQVEPFVWRESTGMALIGHLPGTPGDPLGSANGVSADGQFVVGVSTSAASFPSGGWEAFRWSSATGMVALGIQSGWEYPTTGAGVTLGGMVVGDGLRASTFESEAFSWMPGGQLRRMDLLPGGTFSLATAVLPDGSLIYGGAANGVGSEPCRWTPQGAIEGLGAVPGYEYGSVTAVSPAGDFLAGFAQSVNVFPIEAFRWHQSTGYMLLGDLPGPLVASLAAGISADGSTIVGTAGAGVNDRAFIWDEVHGMRDLQQVLEDDYGLNLTGWRFQRAVGISADGRTIAGWGYNPDSWEEPWIVRLDPTFCYADCDTTTGRGVLDIFDFLCFGNRFAANDPYACDCDTSTGPGVCDIFDFLCFGNAFNAGCP